MNSIITKQFQTKEEFNSVKFITQAVMNKILNGLKRIFIYINIFLKVLTIQVLSKCGKEMAIICGLKRLNKT